jgi:hypothetical protein
VTHEKFNVARRHIERIPLGTSYPDVIRRVVDVVNSPQLKGRETSLIVDATGVGVMLVDMLREANLSPIGVMSTSGLNATYEKVIIASRSAI